MQRWAMYMAGFDYEIQYRSTKANANVDCLSRLPCKGIISDEAEPTMTHIFHVDVLPCTHEQIRKWTRNDPVLSRVIRFTLDGWPSQITEADEELKPFFHRRSEITLEQGVLMWGVRVIVPELGRAGVLEELHTGHVGIVKMP